MMWYQSPGEIHIPDSVTQSHVIMPIMLSVNSFDEPQLSGVILPMNEDHSLLLEHWHRMAVRASLTHKFSMWTKFDATITWCHHTLDYKGCWCLRNPQNEYVLRADLWQFKA